VSDPSPSTPDLRSPHAACGSQPPKQSRLSRSAAGGPAPGGAGYAGYAEWEGPRLRLRQSARGLRATRV